MATKLFLFYGVIHTFQVAVSEFRHLHLHLSPPSKAKVLFIQDSFWLMTELSEASMTAGRSSSETKKLTASTE